MSNIVERLRDNPGIDEAVRLCEEAADTITTLRARVAQLEADKAKLREAMEPFDSIVLGCPGHWRDDHSVYVALGHLRRARLALAETGEKP